jgi:hypothetical protein
MLQFLVVTVNLPCETEEKNGESFKGQKLSSATLLSALTVGRLPEIADQQTNEEENAGDDATEDQY